MSSQVRQNYSTTAEGAVHHLGNMHLQASYTYLSLGFYFDHNDVSVRGSGGHGPLFPELAEKLKGTKHYLKMQNQCGVHILLQNVQKPSQDEWGKSQDAVEAATLMEKKQSHALWSACPGILTPGSPGNSLV
uniref:Ferritin light chain n=1 Tax=Capra hircus TaxID=9925 RepID=A0A8C2S6W2_CAPHI